MWNTKDCSKRLCEAADVEADVEADVGMGVDMVRGYLTTGVAERAVPCR
jgi:hypothetical protein